MNIMSFVDKGQLEPGSTLLLHNKVLSVVGLLADETDPMVSVMKVGPLAVGLLNALGLHVGKGAYSVPSYLPEDVDTHNASRSSRGMHAGPQHQYLTVRRASQHMNQQHQSL